MATPFIIFRAASFIGRKLCIAFVWLGIASWLVLPVLAAAHGKKVFDVPAGGALATLQQFSAQAGGRLLYSVDAVSGVLTRPVQGEFAPRDALSNMLAGTGLEVVEDERSGALAIRREPAPVAAKAANPPRAGPVDSAGAEEPVRLPTFTIRSEKSASYMGKQATSTTRTGAPVADLAQSVVVLNRSFFNDINPTIFAKALNYVGGAQTGTINWSVDRYMIRGFVGEGDYVDGFRTQTDKNTDLNLIDHVEIIKGPAAIFIANQSSTVGGVINKISKSPTSTHVGTFTAQFGLWDGNRADLDVGGPVVPGSKLLWRLLLAAQDSKGYYDFTYEKRHSILPMLAYRFSPDTEIWVKFETFNSHYSSYNGIPLDGRTNQIAAVPITTNLSENTPLNWRTDWFTRLWGQFTSHPTDYLAVRLAAFDSHDTQRRVESVLSPVGAITPTIQPNGSLAFTPYAQYVIPPTYVAGQTIPRTVTAIDTDDQPRRELQNDYVFSFRTGLASHTLLLGVDGIDYPQTTRTYSGGAISTAVTSGIDPFNPAHPGTVSVSLSQPPVNTLERSQTFEKIYVLETASFLDNRVIVSLGSTRNRYALASTSIDYNQTTGAASTPSVVPETRLYKNLGQYGFVVKPLPNVSLFYGYNKNFSTNGIQFGQFLPPQEGTQKEAGLKTTWFDGRVKASLAHFEVTQLNNSVLAYPQTTPPSQVLVPGAVSRGCDGDFTVSIDNHLDVIGSFAWMNAHVPLPAPWSLAPQPFDGKIYRDLPVNNVSERNFAVWTRYRFTDAGFNGLAAGMGVSCLAKRAITDNANLIFYGFIPGRTLVDAMLTYEVGRYKYQLNIDNLFGRNYLYASRSNQVIIPGSPTNVRASITCRF